MFIFVLLLVLLFSIVCVIQIKCPLKSDYDIVCTGHPYNAIINYSHSNHKGWYIKYSLNYTSNINPEECLKFENIRYQTQKYKTIEEASKISVSMLKETKTKKYPTETRDMLNMLTFLIGIILFFVLLLSCTSHKTKFSNIERRGLLNNV